MLYSQQPKIGIDCRFWGISHAGLGRYTRELVLEIVKKTAKDYAFTLFFNGDEWRRDRASLAKCQIIETNVPHYSVFAEQWKLKQIIEREHLDFIHFTHFNVPVFLRTPFIVTIHDLIKHFFKGKPVTTHSLPVYWFKYGGYHLVIGQAIRNAQAIIVPSYFTKDQVAVHYREAESKVKVIYEGVGSPYADSIRLGDDDWHKIQKKYGLEKPFFIYTGSAYASKNVTVLIKSIKQLGDKYQLLIACARNHFWQQLQTDIKRLGLEGQVVMPGLVPDADLHTLYQRAIAFVMPSLMEGFGLPGLEAMAAGGIVLSSNTGSLPEIYGKHATYFNPLIEEKLTSCLQWAADLGNKKRQQMTKHAMVYAQKFMWEKAALQTLEVYKQIINA